MKKMIIAMAAVIAFASCTSNGSTGTSTTDSTNVAVDSTKVDSTASVVDTTATTPNVKVK